MNRREALDMTLDENLTRLACATDPTVPMSDDDRARVLSTLVDSSRQHRTNLRLRTWLFAVAAAGILVALAGLFMAPEANPGLAWADVAERFASFETVRARFVSVFTDEHGETTRQFGQLVVRDPGYQKTEVAYGLPDDETSEHWDFVMIMKPGTDGHDIRHLMLQPPMRAAIITTFPKAASGTFNARGAAEFWHLVRHAHEIEATPIGNTTVGGTNACGFETEITMTGPGSGLLTPVVKTVRVWIDPGTELPLAVEIENESPCPGCTASIRYEPIEWNASVDIDEFRYDIPDDWRVERVWSATVPLHGMVPNDRFRFSISGPDGTEFLSHRSLVQSLVGSEQRQEHQGESFSHRSIVFEVPPEKVEALHRLIGPPGFEWPTIDLDGNPVPIGIIRGRDDDRVIWLEISSLGLTVEEFADRYLMQPE
jgi:outer membrane lipoprotein-sorting protein